MEKQEYILPVTYVKCAFCTAKNHCAACGGELTGDLRAKTGVEDAAVDLLAHTDVYKRQPLACSCLPMPLFPPLSPCFSEAVCWMQWPQA